MTVPPEVEPVVVVLVFGVVTDYCVFFLDHVRRHLQEGLSGVEAAARAAGEVNGIVFVAGVVVALSTGALVVAELPFFRAFGPAFGPGGSPQCDCHDYAAAVPAGAASLSFRDSSILMVLRVCSAAVSYTHLTLPTTPYV